MNMRNGIPIELPSQRRQTSKRIEGKRVKEEFYKGKMVELKYSNTNGTNAFLIMPFDGEYVRQYIAEGWKVIRKWVAV